MVKGLDLFSKYFNDYKDQYVLIGGSACDVIFEFNDSYFRATKDLDIVIIIEVLNDNFVKVLWKFINDGGYRNKFKNNGKQQFYRFDKPTNSNYPSMIELFSNSNKDVIKSNQIIPIHVDDSVESLSAILLDKEYYSLLISGKTIINNLSVLKPEYIILFKIKAYLELNTRRNNGEPIDLKNIKKHKNDILNIVTELKLEKVYGLPIAVCNDVLNFIHDIEKGLNTSANNNSIIMILDLLKSIYLID